MLGIKVDADGKTVFVSAWRGLKIARRQAIRVR